MAEDRFEGLLGSYLLGELRVEEERELARHLQECAECQDELDGIRQTHTLLRQLAADEPPTALKDRVLAQLAEAGVRYPGLFSRTKATRRRATSPGSAIAPEFEPFTNPLFTNKPNTHFGTAYRR